MAANETARTRATAYHEAGHALGYWLMGDGVALVAFRESPKWPVGETADRPGACAAGVCEASCRHADLRQSAFHIEGVRPYLSASERRHRHGRIVSDLIADYAAHRAAPDGGVGAGHQHAHIARMGIRRLWPAWTEAEERATEHWPTIVEVAEALLQSPDLALIAGRDAVLDKTRP